jgi:hypothetical protein
MRVLGVDYGSNYVIVWVSELQIEQTRCSLRAEVMLLILTTPCSEYFFPPRLLVCSTITFPMSKMFAVSIVTNGGHILLLMNVSKNTL